MEIMQLMASDIWVSLYQASSRIFCHYLEKAPNLTDIEILKTSNHPADDLLTKLFALKLQGKCIFNSLLCDMPNPQIII